LSARLVVGQAGQHIQPLPQLRHRFGHGRAGHRLLARLEPIANRLLALTRLRVVVSQQGGLSGDNLRKAVFERLGNVTMKRLAPGTQQRAVGGILHQRMLESILCVGRCSAAQDQLGAYQLCQSVIQLLLRDWRDSADQLVRKMSAKSSSDLRHFAHRR
jgi:hypothetical protein